MPPFVSSATLLLGVCLLSHAAAGPPAVEVPPTVIEGEAPPLPADPSSSLSTIAPDSAGMAGDLLRGVPGVQTRGEGGFGRPVRVSLRGTDSQQALVLLDDVPLNSAMGGGVDLSHLALVGADRVEVYRGGSALFGAAAVGGAIRVVTREPDETPITRVTAGGGSFGTAFVEGLHASRHGPLGVLTGWTLRRSDGRFSFVDTNGNARGRENNDAQGLLLTARASADLGRRARLVVTDHFSANDRGSPGPEQFPTQEARLDELGNLAIARVEWTPAGADVDLALQLWERHDRFQYRDPAPYLPPAVDNRHRVDQLGGLAQLAWYWGAHQVVSVRLEGAWEGAEVSRSGKGQSPSRATGGLVISDEVRLLDERLLLVPALRVDLAEGSGVAWVPRLGIVGRPVDWLTLRTSGSRAYRLPSFQELYYDAAAVRGNPDLRPESAWSFDAAIEAQWEWLGVSVGGFLLAIDNLILFLPKTAYLIEADDSKAATSRGVEASLTLSPLPQLEIRGNFTWVDARFADTGLRLPARSPLLGGGRVTTRWPWFDAFVEAHWQAGFFLDRFEQLNEEGRLMLDAGATGRVLPWLSVSVEARNLLDKRDALDALQQPLAGFSMFGSATFEL